MLFEFWSTDFLGIRSMNFPVKFGSFKLSFDFLVADFAPLSYLVYSFFFFNSFSACRCVYRTSIHQLMIRTSWKFHPYVVMINFDAAHSLRVS